MRKILAFQMVVLMLLSVVFCVPVNAASNTDGKFYYELSFDKSYYKLTDANPDLKGSVKIPKSFKNLPVKEIDRYAVGSCNNITSVTVYSNIKKIGEGAFRNCKKLKKVTLSDYVQTIHPTAFDSTPCYENQNNWSGYAFYIGKHLIKADKNISGNYYVKPGTKTIAPYAFEECSKLKAVILPDSLTAIQEYSFYWCEKLEHIYIPEGVTSIGAYAFACTGLNLIHLPSTLKSIDSSAFPRMNAIYVPGHITKLGGYYVDKKVGMVYGESGSSAQKHAKDMGYPFSLYSEHTHNIETVEYSKASKKTCGITYTKCDGCCQIFDYKVTEQKKPGKVTINEIKNSEGQVLIVWDTVSGADAYRIYRKTAGEKEWSVVGGTRNYYYYDATVKNNKKYSYKVRAVNEAGVGTDNKKTKSIKYITMPKITGLVNTSEGIKISWKKVNSVDGYNLYRHNPTTAKWDKIKTIGSYKTTRFVDKNVKSGEIYYYQIRAYSDSYLSAADGEGGSRLITRLSTPKLLSVTSTKKGVKFTWEKVYGSESYIVYRKTGSGDWKKLKTIEDPTKSSYTDKTAKKGKTYYYSVRASTFNSVSAYNKTGLKIKDKY